MSVQDLIRDAQDHMNKSVDACKRELATVRTGKASTAILDNVKIDYYGTPTPLRQIASVSAPEARLLTVQPFDKSATGAIDKAIRDAGLGLNPSTDGNLIRIPIPALTEERRKELVKVVRGMIEHGRVAVRNVRHHTNDRLKALEKDGDITADDNKRETKRIQDMTDAHVKQLDELLKTKEAEIMEV